MPSQESKKALILASKSEQQSIDIGAALGEVLENQLLSDHWKGGATIGLSGTLGAGKTKLTQGIAFGLGVPVDNVTSPTFTLCVPHQGHLPMLHLDAYRLGSLEEVDELGLDEQLELGVVLIVEWAERIAAALPPLDVSVHVSQLEESSREFRFSWNTSGGQSIVEALAAKLS